MFDNFERKKKLMSKEHGLLPASGHRTKCSTGPGVKQNPEKNLKEFSKAEETGWASDSLWELIEC